MGMAERPTRHESGWLKDRLRSPESSSTSEGPGREREGIVDGRSSHMDWGGGEFRLGSLGGG